MRTMTAGDAERDGGGAPGRPPFRPDPPLVIGLCGGVAAGKSAVAAAFAAAGLRHVDADRLAREVTARPAVVAAIAAALGAAAARPDGSLDRAAVARIVFADPAARERLEAITHPPVRAAILDEVAAALGGGDSVLLDVPLLIENGLVELCDEVVFVAASDAVRRERARTRGWADGELARREAAQLPLAEKRARADHAIDNDGPLDATRRQVHDLLQALSRSGHRRGATMRQRRLGARPSTDA